MQYGLALRMQLRQPTWVLRSLSLKKRDHGRSLRGDRHSSWWSGWVKPGTQRADSHFPVGTVPEQSGRCYHLPDSVELLMVLAGVVTSGSSCVPSSGGRAGFSGSSLGSPEQGTASSCSPSVEMASLGSRPELSLRLLLSVSEELDVDNCCLN